MVTQIVLEQVDLEVLECNILKDCYVPISEKYNLTIAEAAAYFGIGRDKLYELVKEDGCKFVIKNGKNILIKRKKLEQYLDPITYI